MRATVAAWLIHVNTNHLASHARAQYSEPMPAPSLPGVDWNEVRTLAVAIGVREAARQMGLSEESVKARSRREGWLEHKHEAAASLTREHRTQALKTIAPNAPIMPTAADILSKMGTETRASLASVAQRASRRLEKLDEDELIEPSVAEVASKYTSMASKVHAWEAKQGAASNGVVVNIALMGLTPEMPIADV